MNKTALGTRIRRWLRLAAVMFVSHAVAADGKPEPIPLWTQDVPMARDANDKPTISVHLAPVDKATGAAVVICPGGGYSTLMESYEGHDIARWLNQAGITGIVLKYRVKILHPAPLLDAQRALRTVRARAAEWKIDPKRIGVMGFSAGGHVAATLSTHFDAGNPQSPDPIERVSCRPDFTVLVYPLITMGEKTHRGSRTTLLGPNPTQEQLDSLSNEKQVTDQTPPAFLVHSTQDKVVSSEHSAMYAAALKAHNIPCEYFEMTEGAHGLGAGKGPLWAQWQAACMKWLQTR